MKFAPAEDSRSAGWPAGEGRRLAWIFLTAVLAILPLLLRGNSCGHDFDFHLQSWLHVAGQWRHGLLYPHWVSAANYGAGEPRLVFYPPASWMLGALLGMLLPWKAVGGAFVLLALSGSGLALYALAREWLPRDAAALAGCLYIVNPYAMFVVYERSAFGELLAGIWLPLILLFALKGIPATCRLAGPHSDRRSSVSRLENVVPLALTIAAVWLTNAPAAVMGCYMLAVVAAIAAFSERQWWPIYRAAAGAALGVAAAAFYIVPAAWERRWVDIARAIGPGMRPEDSFLFGHTGEAFHDQVLHTASWIAVTLLAATFAGAVAAWRSGAFASFKDASTTKPTAVPARVLQSLIALPILALILMLPSSGFLWNHAPELRFLQFPWRWLLVVSISLSMLWAVALGRWFQQPPMRQTGKTKSRRSGLIWLGLAVAAAILIAPAQKLYWQPCDEEDMVSAQVATFHGGGFEGTDEYTTPDTDNGAIQQGLPPVRILAAADADEADSSVEQNPAWTQPPGEEATSPTSLKLETWNAEAKAFTVASPTPAFAVLRLMDYPAWEVRVNGEPLSTRPHRMDGLMAIPLRAGTSTISVHYAVTRDVRWARAITVAALLVILLLVLRQRRYRNRP